MVQLKLVLEFWSGLVLCVSLMTGQCYGIPANATITAATTAMARTREKATPTASTPNTNTTTTTKTIMMSTMHTNKAQRTIKQADNGTRTTTDKNDAFGATTTITTTVGTTAVTDLGPTPVTATTTATTIRPPTTTPASEHLKQLSTLNESINVTFLSVRNLPTAAGLSRRNGEEEQQQKEGEEKDAENPRSSPRSRQNLRPPATPRITADIKASRIYESFRTTPDDYANYHGDNGSDEDPTDPRAATHRSKRYSVAAHMEATTYRAFTNATERHRAAGGGAGRLRKRTASADMLSRNISIILENLLKSYEQSQLPTHGEGVPTVVRTNILIRSMGPVSELDMDYSMDCYFRQYWRDKRLSFQGPIKSLSLSIKMLDKIWRPDTYFYNGKQSHIHTITVPNKLLRLDQNGGILYSMRLTIKATCPMELKNFPMDRQSCPLIIGSYGYTRDQLVYEWINHDNPVSFEPGMTLNQFDLINKMHRNFTYTRREGEFSVLHVAFNLKRHTGYFLIQVYVPCILIVVLSWVSFWIHREATSDRVGLCITAVLTLSTISLDSRTDLPKVKYATGLDWFLMMSFVYCIATLLEFAGVHYFTKLGSGEIPISEDEWEDMGEEPPEALHGFAEREEDEEVEEESLHCDGVSTRHSNESIGELPASVTGSFRKRNALICPIYNDPTHIFQTPSSHASTMERTTQTEPPIISKSRQMWLCFIGDDKFRKQRERDAAAIKGARHVNSVSLIDRVARIAFPASFVLFNLLYWLAYGMYKKEFSWATLKG